MELSFLTRAGIEINAYLTLHGYELTTFKSYGIALKNIQDFFDMHRVLNYSYELMEKFRADVLYRKNCGMLGRNYFHIFMRVSHYVDNFFRGDVLTRLPCDDEEERELEEMLPTAVIDVCYRGPNGNLAEQFLSSVNYGPTVRERARNYILLFLDFIEREGWCPEDLIKLDKLARFIISQGQDPNRLKDMMKYVKAFLLFLSNKGTAEYVPSSFIRIKSSGTKPVLPCFSYEDLEKIFSAIDPWTPDGCREYAIIMMALYTGMRGCDICNMRISDVDFEQHVISLRQQKTKAFYELPMMPELETALRNHLKNRISSEYDNFFVNDEGTPYMNLSNILSRILDAAGLAHGMREGDSQTDWIVATRGY